MMKSGIGFALAGLVLLGACGGSSRGTGGGGGQYAVFADAMLSGKISGQAWTFVSGQARPSYKGDNYISIELWDVKSDTPCGFTMGSDRSVIGSLKKSVGLVELSPTENFTLFDSDGNKNTVITEGAYEITEITADHVAGRLRGSFKDDNNGVNGTFVVPMCPAR